MFQNSDSFRSEAYNFQQDFFIAGQLDDAVKILNFKKILKVIGGIYSQLVGQNKTFGIWIDVAYPLYINRQIMKGFTSQKLKKKLTGSASTHDGQINGMGHFIFGKIRFYRKFFFGLALLFHDSLPVIGPRPLYMLKLLQKKYCQVE